MHTAMAPWPAAMANLESENRALGSACSRGTAAAERSDGGAVGRYAWRPAVTDPSSKHPPAVPAGQPGQPHLDPGSWGRLVDSLDIASVLVVLSSWIGPQLRGVIGAEDIWQETLWLGWRDRHQQTWRNLVGFRSWLLGIARHRIDDAARRRLRHKRGGGRAAAVFSDLASQGSASAQLPPRSTTPSRIAGHRERAVIMERAQGRLPQSLREVVHLRLFEELPMIEVAARLAIPLSTAKERLVRGVQRYREVLAAELRGDSIAEGPSPP